MTNNPPLFYIGLMSGTSADGIDLALVDFTAGKINLIASFFQAYTPAQRQAITALYQPGNNEIEQAHALDISLAKLFADCIQLFLQQQALTPHDIIAIGNHGQTIRHRPQQEHSFTVQIGCNQTLASLTGIRVIGDFRKKDMVYGGQGAPLVPAFHQALFPVQQHNLCIVNIGGIANISFLPASNKQQILGFDTGPGNALMDAWFQQHNSGHYDENGQWAAQGKCQPNLLASLLKDPYFQLTPPKSTGREYFHLAWLQKYLKATISAVDVQATLLQLTAQTIADNIQKLSLDGNVYLCGGGVFNTTLVNAITALLPAFIVEKTEGLNINGDALEAMAFAWFAYAFDKNIIGNIPSATGASKGLVLGIEFSP